jgi:hypothetical protein
MYLTNHERLNRNLTTTPMFCVGSNVYNLIRQRFVLYFRNAIIGDTMVYLVHLFPNHCPSYTTMVDLHLRKTNG